MKQKLFKIYFSLASAGLFFIPLFFAKADACSDFKNMFNIGQQGAGVDTSNVSQQVPVFCTASDITTWAINLLLGLAGSAAVVFIIVGGYQYITSNGNDETAEQARKTITNSVIGLIVIIMAYAIVRIVVNAVT